MSKKSKNSEDQKNPNRPFDPEILRQAEALASKYQVILWEEENWYYGHGLEFPHAYGDGKTPTAAVIDTRKAFVLAAASMLEDGERPPVPTMEQTRNVQVNIRMNAEEKEIITQRARQKGFRSISDYIRAIAVA